MVRTRNSCNQSKLCITCWCTKQGMKLYSWPDFKSYPNKILTGEMDKSPLCPRHWKSDPSTSIWSLLSEASLMMDQTLLGQKGDSLVPSSRRWLFIWSLPWKSNLIIQWFSRFGAAGGFGAGQLGVGEGGILWPITISEHVRWMDQHLPPVCLLTLDIE